MSVLRLKDGGVPQLQKSPRLRDRGVEDIMAREITVWYDKEGDYLEVILDRKKGYFRETENDAVMEKVDEEGNVIGLSILKVSAFKKEKPFSVTLK